MPTTLTVTEAAEKLRVCEDTIYTMVKRKQIPHFRVRRRIFFRLESLEAWMRQQEAEIEAIAATHSVS